MARSSSPSGPASSSAQKFLGRVEVLRAVSWPARHRAHARARRPGSGDGSPRALPGAPQPRQSPPRAWHLFRPELASSSSATSSYSIQRHEGALPSPAVSIGLRHQCIGHRQKDGASSERSFRPPPHGRPAGTRRRVPEATCAPQGRAGRPPAPGPLPRPGYPAGAEPLATARPARRSARPRPPAAAAADRREAVTRAAGGSSSLRSGGGRPPAGRTRRPAPPGTFMRRLDSASGLPCASAGFQFCTR